MSEPHAPRPAPRRRPATPKPDLTPQERIAEAAARGDLPAVLAFSRESCHDTVWCMGTRDFDLGQEYIPQCLDTLRHDGPAEMVEAVYSELLKMQAMLIFRVQHQITRDIRICDRRTPSQGNLPNDVVNEWLPRLERMQEAYVRATKTMATVLHTLRLAEASKPRQAPAPVEQGGNVVNIHAGQEQAAHA